MRKQDQLIALIHSLTQNEKRYFKLYSSLQKSDKTFIRLFDELVKSNSYEPDTLSKKLKLPKPVLAHSKSYLEKTLLSSLRLYEQDSNRVNWLNNQLQEAQLLYRRQQFELAFSVTDKALKKALDWDEFMPAFNLTALRYNLLIATNRISETADARKQRKLHLERVVEIEELLQMSMSFSRVVAGENDALPPQIEQNPLFNTTPDKLKSRLARILWHEMMNYYCFHVKQDVDRAIRHNMAKLQLFKAQPQLIPTRPNSYYMSINYLCTFYEISGRYKEALRMAERMEAETSQAPKDIPANLLSHFYLSARLAQTLLLCHQQNFSAAIKKAENALAEKDKLPTGHIILLLHFYSVALFHSGRYDAAKKVCEELQAMPTHLYKHILFANRLLLVMLHHAMGHQVLVPYLFNAADSWAKRHKVDEPSAIEVLRWFRRFEKLQTPKEHRVFFTELKNAAAIAPLKEFDLFLGLVQWCKTSS